MTQVAVAPCSPFSVSTELHARRAPSWPAAIGVRLHTHGCETVEEEKFCHELFGMGPTDYFESTGWLGDDVWMAHCVHMNDSDIAAFARTGTGVAHCPSSNARLAAGIARVPDMLAAGRPGRPRRRRHRLQRVRRAAHRTAQRPAHQPPRRPPRGRPDRPSGAAPGHLRRRPGPRPRRPDRLPGARQARRPGAVEAGHPRPLLHRRPGHRAGLRRGRPGHPLAGRTAGRSSRTAASPRSTRTPSPAPPAPRPSASPGSPVSPAEPRPGEGRPPGRLTPPRPESGGGVVSLRLTSAHSG